MTKKYGLTKHERKLLDKAQYYQYKAEEIAKETVSKFNWGFDELEDVDDISVESVEECDTDDD